MRVLGGLGSEMPYLLISTALANVSSLMLWPVVPKDAIEEAPRKALSSSVSDTRICRSLVGIPQTVGPNPYTWDGVIHCQVE